MLALITVLASDGVSSATKPKSKAKWCRLPTVAALTAILVGGGLLAHGLYIPIKADLAQVLLNRAWDKTVVSQQQAPPWPWADTFPIARLSASPASYSVDQIVLANSSGRNLAFGPTHVAPSAVPGDFGHTVISGHRDTHFSWLGDLQVGDQLSLESPKLARYYTVVGFEIIDLATQSFELHPERDGWLSLVTCYPLDGFAANPSQRYIVHAKSTSAGPP